jgi:predicted nuclease of restriction endonuclease-like (RecB) superfamily
VSADLLFRTNLGTVLDFPRQKPFTENRPMLAPLTLPTDYGHWLKSLKSRIATARQRAALTVNQELIKLYHSIGKDILHRQANEGWGAKVIQRLSRDLGEAFPDMKGFSTRNLKYMKFFAETCPNSAIGQQAAAQLPWFHIVSLLTKIDDPIEREWYAQHAVAEGWSRQTLYSHIRNQLVRALPKPLDTSLPSIEEIEAELKGYASSLPDDDSA